MDSKLYIVFSIDHDEGTTNFTPVAVCVDAEQATLVASRLEKNAPKDSNGKSDITYHIHPNYTLGHDMIDILYQTYLHINIYE